MSNQPNPHDGVDELAAEVQPDSELDETVDLEELYRKTRQQPPPSDDERVQEAERKVLLAHAELENFRKRMQREADQQLKYSNLPLLRDLLDVVDNLNRAADAARTDTANTGALLSGVEMVGQQLQNILAKYGCKPVTAVGSEFDPNVHEAIAQMPSADYASGLVAQEVAVGYVLHDRVVRPSSVIVSTGPASN
jgi:molecular chaperone GrpE